MSASSPRPIGISRRRSRTRRSARICSIGSTSFRSTVPPLRERIEDIPALVWEFVDEFSKSFGKTIESVHKASMRAAANATRGPATSASCATSSSARSSSPPGPGSRCPYPNPCAPPRSSMTLAQSRGRTHPRHARRHQLAGARTTRSRGAPGSQADHARRPDGQAGSGPTEAVIPPFAIGLSTVPSNRGRSVVFAAALQHFGVSPITRRNQALATGRRMRTRRSVPTGCDRRSSSGARGIDAAPSAFRGQCRCTLLHA